MSIRAVAFDFFGTLTPAITADTRRTHLAAIGAVLGRSAAEVHREFRASFGERVRGDLGDLPGTLRVIAERLGLDVTPEQLEEIVRLRYDGQVVTFSFRPDVPDTLWALHRRGLRTAVVSDCSVELPMIWPDLLIAPLVDATVFSCVERTAKPDPRMFALAAERLQVRADQVLYVGDGGGNELPGAATTGMRPVLLCAEDRDLDDSVGRRDDWAGERIGTIGGVLELVDAGSML